MGGLTAEVVSGEWFSPLVGDGTLFVVQMMMMMVR